MNFHIGKIYNMPTNFYFYKANQPRLWMEYCKKMEKNREVVLNISEINNLEQKLQSIDELKYNSMFKYYKQIKYLFELDGMTTQILNENYFLI